MAFEREVRNVAQPFKADKESRLVEGRAILFEVESDGLDFVEIIDSRALDGVLERSNVFALLNHTRDRGILARCKFGSGSLALETDTEGLLYRFAAPRTALGDELLEGIERGDISQSSFAFTTERDEWRKRDNGIWERRVLQVGELFDVSPVYDAAYSQTTVCTRGRDQAEQELRAAELDGYYNSIESIFKKF